MVPTRWNIVTVCAIFLYFFTFAIISEARPNRVKREPDLSYDYIIVGAGTAGGTLANRLSEDPNIRVLLLEAGGDDTLQLITQIPAANLLNLLASDVRQYFTEPQEGLFGGFSNGRALWGRGNVLGGSSSVNVLFYVRGAMHDFDRWAEHTGDQTWDYRSVLPYFLKSEGNTDFDMAHSKYHSATGPLGVSLYEDEFPIQQLLVNAFEEAGIPYNSDYNGRKIEGIGFTQMTSREGVRSSSATAYIHPAETRPNLDIVVGAFVQRVVLENNVAVGVDYIKGERTYRVLANSEVILSAGAIGSPQILLLSGIGPREHLEEMNIDVHADLPVGQNLQDHIMYPFSISLSAPVSYPVGGPGSGSTVISSLFQYLAQRRGQLAHNGFPLLAFHSISEANRDLDWPELEFGIMGYPIVREVGQIFHFDEELLHELNPEENYSNGWTCWPILLRPSSRGNLTLRSTDPLDDPVLFANYLDTQEDVDVLLKGIDICKDVLNTSVMASLGARVTNQNLSICAHHGYDTREYWSCMLRAIPFTVWHYSGTCAMGASDDPNAVVDSELRVRGVSGLRVVDASIMPYVTTGNTNAPVYMIAEKAADLIKGRPLLAPLDLD